MIVLHSQGDPRRCLAIAALLLPALLTAEPASKLPPLPEDLIPALHPVLVTALEQSPQMILRNIQVAQAEAGLLQSRAPLWPSLSGSASYNESKSAVSSISSSVNGFFYSLALSQPIFHWGVLKAGADRGKISLKIAERDYSDGYRLLLGALRKDFLVLITYKVKLRNTEFALKVAEETLALAEQKLKAGAISAEDIMEPRLAVQEARLARDRSVEELEAAKRQFVLTAGQASLDLDSILPDEIPAPVYDAAVAARLLAQFERDGVNETYAALDYRDYIAQANLDYKVARFQLWPMFGLSANISQQSVTSAGPNFVSTTAVSSSSYNVTASWSIFDGFSSRGSRLSALYRRRGYERNLQSYIEQSVAQARSLEKQLAFAWRQLELSQLRRDLSENGVKRLIDNFNAGQVPQTSVAKGRLELNNSELNLSGARGDYLNRWSDYLSTLGVDPMLEAIPDRFPSHDR